MQGTSGEGAARGHRGKGRISPRLVTDGESHCHGVLELCENVDAKVFTKVESPRQEAREPALRGSCWLSRNRESISGHDDGTGSTSLCESGKQGYGHGNKQLKCLRG